MTRSNPSNPLKVAWQKMGNDSTSWGSLLLLAMALATLVVLMVMVSRGWLFPQVPLF